MADYWKSQPRKFCEFCKCWIADNKPSRDFHEKGKKHQQNVKEKITMTMKKGVKEAKKEDEMSDMIRRMNEGAMKSLKNDIQKDPSMAAQYGIQIKSKEPEPQPDDSDSDSSTDSSENEAKPDTGGGGSDEEPHPHDVWKEEWTPEGYCYYWHTITGESKWVPPDGYTPTWERNKEGQTADTTTAEAQPSKGESQSTDQVTEVTSCDGKSQASATTEEKETQKITDKQPESIKQSETVAASFVPEDIPVCDIALPADIPLPPEPPSSDSPPAPADNKPCPDDISIPQQQPPLPVESTVPEKPSPYGLWESVPEPIEQAPVDLQLPEKHSTAVEMKSIPVNEPKIKFRQKKVDTLGAEFVAFKKRKLNASNRKGNMRTTDTEKADL